MLFESKIKAYVWNAQKKGTYVPYVSFEIQNVPYFVEPIELLYGGGRWVHFGEAPKRADPVDEEPCPFLVAVEEVLDFPRVHRHLGKPYSIWPKSAETKKNGEK